MSEFKKLLTDSLNSDVKVVMTRIFPEQPASPQVLAGQVSAGSVVSSPSVACAEQIEQAAEEAKEEQSQASGQDKGASTDIAKTGVAQPMPESPSSTMTGMRLMQEETARRNSVSNSIESIKRLNGHLEDANDSRNLNSLLENLSRMTIFPIPNSLSVQAVLPVEYMSPEAILYLKEASGGSVSRLAMECAGLLGAIFAAAPGSYQVVESDGYAHPIANNVIVAAASGMGKSKTASRLRQPFDEIQAQRERENATVTTDAKQKSDLAVIKAMELGARQKLRKFIKETGALDAAAEYIQSDYERIENLRDSLLLSRPTRSKILLNSVTMTQLPYEMAENNEVGAIIDPEGEIFRQIRPDNDAIIVKSFTGDYFSHVTRSNGSVELHNPILSMCLFVQHDKMENFYGNEKFISHGVSARFLPVIIPDEEGANYSFEIEMSVSSKQWFRETIRRLAAVRRICVNGKMRHRAHLRLNADARSALSIFRQQLIDETNAGRFDHCKEFRRRLDSHAVRLAGALHLMEHSVPDEHEISERTMQGGIAFAMYFCKHALAAFDPSARDGIKFARMILAHLRERPCHWVERRNIHRAIGSGRYKSPEIQPGFDELEKHNFVRRYITATRKEMYVIHPQAYFEFLI